MGVAAFTRDFRPAYDDDALVCLYPLTWQGRKPADSYRGRAQTQTQTFFLRRTFCTASIMHEGATERVVGAL